MMLANVPLLAGLAPAALADLELVSTDFAIGAGDTLFRQGDEASALYIVTEGRIAIASRTPGDEEVQVIEAGPGAMVGELGLLDGGRRSATARAVTDSRGIAMALSRFRGLAAIGRPAAFALSDRIRIEVAGRFRATIAAIAAQSVVEDALIRPPATGRMPPPQPAEGVAAMLRGLVRFAALRGDDADRLVAMGGIVDAPRGTVIGRIGETADAVYLVMRGAARTGLPRNGGLEPLAVHGPGEFVGLAAMIDRQPHPLSCEIAEAATLLRLGREALETLRAETSELACQLFDIAGQQLVRDLRRANRHRGRAEALARFRAGGQH